MSNFRTVRPVGAEEIMQTDGWTDRYAEAKKRFFYPCESRYKLRIVESELIGWIVGQSVNQLVIQPFGKGVSHSAVQQNDIRY